MIGTINSYRNNFSGLGAADQTVLPEHYLVPMSNLEIDSYIYQEKNKGPFSLLAVGCDTSWAGSFVPCFTAMLEIERGNLLYVNKFISYEQLQGVYKEAHKMLESIPQFPTFKEQLKNSGAFLVGAIVGFFTQGGPVGLFIGAGTAVSKMVAEQRAKRQAYASGLINPLLEKAKAGAENREPLQAGMPAFLIPVLIGTAVAGALLIYFGKDLKEQFQN